jgi:hypothetical protein
MWVTGTGEAVFTTSATTPGSDPRVVIDQGLLKFS